MRISSLLLSALTFVPLVRSQRPAYCGVGSWTNPIEVGECVVASTSLRGPTSFSDCGYTVSYSQWYAFNGTGSTVTASTCNEGTNFNTRISIFENSCDGTGPTVCAGWNDNACGSQSSVTIDTKEGKTYYVGIDGVNDAKGSFAFLISNGNVSQTESCTSPTCPRAAFCEMAQDIFVENTILASTTDKLYSFGDMEMCGELVRFSTSDEIKAYRFRSGGGNATAVFCNMDGNYSVALQVLERGCDDSNLCHGCHAVTTTGPLECKELAFDTEADKDYYLIPTAFPAWWGPYQFNLTLSGTGATAPPTVSPAPSLDQTQVPIPTSAMPLAAGETREPTMISNDGACGCSCEVDADESTKFDCRHLILMPNELDTESKCRDYCESVKLPESCASYNIFHLLTCPAEYVFNIQCVCITDDGTCQSAESSFGKRNMTQEQCGINCQNSGGFAHFCNLQEGANFTTGFSVGLQDTITVSGNSEGFGIELCEDDSGGCGETMLFSLDELDSGCGCHCTTHNCTDFLTGIYVNPVVGQYEQCTQYCQTKSPCSFAKDIRGGILKSKYCNKPLTSGCLSCTWILAPLTLLLLITL